MRTLMSLVLVLFFCSQLSGTQPFGVNKIVIDAGHGGHDPGCLGKRSKEKEVTLGIALKLGKYIEEHFPDVKVIYTRKTDEFVELYERADIANNARADLFICIHCNSACTFDKNKKKEICSTEISGVESWVMGLHKSEANLEVAKRENEVILLEKDYTRQYDGFDPSSPEANIIFSLYQNAFLDQSLRMATFIQNEVKNKGRVNRGVKQAGFLVLYKTSMPSVLIETGFLSNPAEEKFLASQKGQEEIAQAVFRAFKSYKNSIESFKVETSPVKSDSPDTIKKQNKTAGDILVPEKDSVGKPAQKATTKTDENTKVSIDSKVADSEGKNSEEGLFWCIQFYTSPKPLPSTHKVYKNFEKVREFKENGMYKYATGVIKDKNEAIRMQSQVRANGYKDAFVIAIYNNKKISVKEADQILRQKIN